MADKKQSTQASGKVVESVPTPRIPRGSTTVAKEAKAPAKAATSPSTKATAKPTIRGLQAEVEVLKVDLEKALEKVTYYSNVYSGSLDELAIADASYEGLFKNIKDEQDKYLQEFKLRVEVAANLRYELNKSWWTITKERFVQSIIRPWA